MSNKRLNEEIGQMLCHWINNFSFSPKISSISEIARTDHLFRLMSLIFRIKDTDDFMRQIPPEKRVEAIDTFISNKCQIQSPKDAINAQKMLSGDQWECAKLALIILYHGLAQSIDEFTQAADRLPNAHYTLIEHFYTVLEQHKSLHNASDIRVYEAYLSSVDLPPKRIRTPTSARHHDSASILSPMQKASLNSPNNKRANSNSSAKKALPLIDEEAVHHEKRRHELLLREKEAQIDELHEQIGEREVKIKKFENQCEDFARKLAELKTYREKADEFDSMVEKVRAMEHENALIEDKLRKLQLEKDELCVLRVKFDEQQMSLNRLSDDLDAMAKKERLAQSELKRLKMIEAEVEHLIAAKNVKEGEIVRLIEERAVLQQQIGALNKSLNETRMRLDEQVDELQGVNACKDTEINLLKAKLTNLEENFSASENELKQSIAAKDELIDELKEKVVKLEIELRRKEDEKSEIERVLRETVLSLEVDVRELKSQNECLQSCLSSERVYAQEERQKLDAARSTNAELEAVLVEVRARVREKSEENLHLIELNKEFIEKNAALDVLVGELRAALETERHKLDEIKQQMAERISALSNDHRAHLERINEHNLKRVDEINLAFGKERDALNGEIRTGAEMKVQLEEKLARLGEKFDALKKDFGALNAQKCGAEARVSELLEQLDSMRRECEARLQDEKKAREFDLAGLSEKIGVLEVELGAKNDALRAFESRVNELEGCIERERALNLDYESRFGALQHDFVSKVSDLEDLRARFECVQAALSAKEGENETISAKMVSLEQQIVEKINEYAQLEAKIGAYDTAIVGKSAECDELSASVARLTEELRAKSEHVLKIEEKLSEIEAVLAAKDAENDAFSAKIVDLQSRCDQYESQIGLANQFESEANAKLAEMNTLVAYNKELSGKLEQFEIESCAKLAEMNAVVALNKELGGKVEQFENELSNKDAEMSKLVAFNKELSGKVEQLESEASAKLAEINNMVAFNKELNDKLVLFESESSAKLAEINTLVVCNKELSGKVEQLESEANAKLTEMNTLVAFNKELSGKLEQFEGEANAKLVEMNTLVALNKELSGKLELFENELSNKDAEIVQIQSQKRQLEAELSEAKIELTRKSENLARYDEALNEKEAKLKQFDSELALKARKIQETDHVLNALQMEYKGKFELQSKEIEVKEQLIAQLQNELNNAREQTLAQNGTLRKEHIEMKESFEKQVAQLAMSKDIVEKRLAEVLVQLNDEKQNFLKVFTELGAKKNECELMHVQYKQLQIQLNTAEINKVPEHEVVQLRKELIEAKARNEALAVDNEKLKESQKELEAKLDTAITNHNDMKTYAQKLDEHYQKKKAMFTKREDEIKEARDELERVRSANNEQLLKLTNQGLEYQNQINDLDDRYKALAKENLSLRTQLDYLERKLRSDEKKCADVGGSSFSLNTTKREQSYHVSSSLGATSGARMANTLLMNTPKPSSKFLDDSTVKYSSPKTGNEFPEFNQPLDDFSFRRQSIDTISSFRTGAANSTLGGASAASGLSQQPAALSRFDTISENDIEAGINSEKFLPFEQHHQPERDINRLSILLNRNQKQKPHLQSSYALETFNYPQPVMEKVLRKDREILKSKTNLKRPFDENSGDVTAIELAKKTHLADASNTMNVTHTLPTARPSGTFKSVKDVLKR